MLKRRQPQMSNARCELIVADTVIDQDGQPRPIHLPGERAQTLYLDKREIVTLMTLGQMPEALVLGYLRNQRLVDDIGDIAAVHVDWEVGAAAVTTVSGRGAERCAGLLEKRTVTSGCGQGTLFGDQMEQLAPLAVPAAWRVPRSTLIALLDAIRRLDTVYKQSGSVHGCALAHGSDILYHVEDIGRHNAVDTISGLMWLDGTGGEDKLFYTTGRLTSEMVIKAVQMGIPVLVSRSGTTEMGLAVARRCGVTLVGRARNDRFLVFSQAERIDFDA